MRAISYLDAVREGLAEEMARDPSVVYLGEDITHGSPMDLVEGLPQRFGGGRFFSTPISEAGYVGAALGMALTGLRPVVDIMWADLFFYAADGLINGIAKMRYKTNGKCGAPIVLWSRQGGWFSHGATQSQCVESLFAHYPGFKLVAPADPYDVKGLLKAAIRDDDPVVFLHPKDELIAVFRAVQLKKQRGSASEDGWPESERSLFEVPAEEYVLPIGKARVRREGTSVTLVTWGTMVRRSLEAAAIVEKDGISVEVIDLRTLIPLDREAILGSVGRTKRLVIAHEAHRRLGLGAEIARMVHEELFDTLERRIETVAARDLPIACSPQLERAILPTTDDLVAALRRCAA